MSKQLRFNNYNRNMSTARIDDSICDIKKVEVCLSPPKNPELYFDKDERMTGYLADFTHALKYPESVKMEITDLEIETEAQHNRKAKYIVKSKHTDEELYEKIQNNAMLIGSMEKILKGTASLTTPNITHINSNALKSKMPVPKTVSDMVSTGKTPLKTFRGCGDVCGDTLLFKSLSLESLDSIKLDFEINQTSDGHEQICNRDQSSKGNIIDCELHSENLGKKHGLVRQITGQIRERFGLKSKVTPVVRFVKPEVFTEEKEDKNKNILIKKLMSLKNKVSTTPVKRFVEQGEKKKKGPFGRLCTRTGKALYNLVIKIK